MAKSLLNSKSPWNSEGQCAADIRRTLRIECCFIELGVEWEGDGSTPEPHTLAPLSISACPATRVILVMEANLPPEFQPFLDELADTPENVKTMWRYAIVLAMIDDEKARVVGTREVDGRVLLSIRTGGGRRI